MEAFYTLVTMPQATYTESKIILFAISYVSGFSFMQASLITMLSKKIATLERRLSDLAERQPTTLVQT